jgi:hypothetical protein
MHPRARHFAGPTDKHAVAAMASWDITAVRLPLNEDCWLGINGAPARYSGARYRAAIRRYVIRLNHARYLRMAAPAIQLGRGTGRGLESRCFILGSRRGALEPAVKDVSDLCKRLGRPGQRLLLAKG